MSDKIKLKVKIVGTGKTAAGMRIPDAVVAELGTSKKPPVKVSVNGYTYRSSIAHMGGEFWLGISNERRKAAGVAAGQEVEIELELDTEPRVVEVPADFQAALDANPQAKTAFEALAYSHKSRHVLAIAAAKAPETRARRIDGAIKMLTEAKN